MRLPRVLTPPAISHSAGHVPLVLGVSTWPRVLWLAFGRDGGGTHLAMPPLFVSHLAGHVPCVLGVLVWLRECCFGSRVDVLDAASMCAAASCDVPPRWPCALRAERVDVSTRAPARAVMAAASLACRRIYSNPIPMAIWRACWAC